MLRGRFGNTTTAPYLEAYVSVPRLGHKGYVSFLVDTGADGTVLMPADTKKLGINSGSLRNPTASQGVGGVARGYSEQIILGFSDGRYVYSYLLDIESLGDRNCRLRRITNAFHHCLEETFLITGE